MSEQTTRSGRRVPSPGFTEFIVLMAAAMGLVSLSIDNVLPAFSAIGRSLGITDPNDLQYLVYVYMVGFSFAQIVYGPLSDVIGRRTALLSGIAIYAVGSLVAILANDFTTLLVARVVQGIGGASARVITVTIVRDRYSGDEMARVMSFVMMVFLIVPVFAPAIGSLFLMIGGWHAVFGSMLGMALALSLAYVLRLPETLPPERRMTASAGRLLEAVRVIVTSRVVVGYALAQGFLSGALMGYIGSSQQIFQTEVYGLGDLFPLVFGGLAGGMVVASMVSARIVGRLGMRRLSLISVTAFTAVAAALAVVASLTGGRPPLAAFVGMFGVILFSFAVAMPNLNAIAMETLGAVAGTAASLIGSFTTVLGAVFGALVGQAFDGTVMPIAIGCTLLGAATLAVMVWADRGRLLRDPLAAGDGA